MNNRLGEADVLRAMIGQNVVSIEGVAEKSECMTLVTAEGHTLVLRHEQDCCESVEIAQVDGDPQDLVGAPLLMCEAADNEGENLPQEGEYCTWVFYRFATSKGYVTVRWLGVSNGYYCERAKLSYDGERVW